MEKLYTLREAARILNLSLSTVRRKVLQGELMATSVPGPHGERWMVKKVDVDRLFTPEPVQDEPVVQGLERFEVVDAVPMNGVPLEVHQMALQTAHRALTELEVARVGAERYQRRFEALQGEMKTYQLALSDQAESLAERDARMKEQLALAEENTKRIAEFEAERASMREELRTYQERVSWLERRVPRWVRRVFGAG